MSYSKRLDVLKLTTLEKRRLRDLIEVYKLLTGRENIDYTALLQLDDSCYGTRGHKFKLKKYRSRLDIRKHFDLQQQSRVTLEFTTVARCRCWYSLDLQEASRCLQVCNEWGIQSWWSFLDRHQQVTSNKITSHATLHTCDPTSRFYTVPLSNEIIINNIAHARANVTHLVRLHHWYFAWFQNLR